MGYRRPLTKVVRATTVQKSAGRGAAGAPRTLVEASEYRYREPDPPAVATTGAAVHRPVGEAGPVGVGSRNPWRWEGEADWRPAPDDPLQHHMFDAMFEIANRPT